MSEDTAVFLKFGSVALPYILKRPQNAHRMANGEDLDQTVHEGAVWCGSTLVAKTCLSQ